ncbi:hypothetical protein DCAR_0206535 [Daucus carota subsp. sativus]|uniref:Stress-related protein n=1 Tax=Daucus carota subsp. sativus TaxID=79200 RepID=A0AAF0WD40_DAUCS|nr:PREDICTED: stress-related protein-like isoform X1 [Daucus carota subsp. sativus]WOG87312.1 hypothetical protein DCAR_0206535 [Daucus carota subsp. sativus]
MADTQPSPPAQSVVVDEKKLKYLDFVQVAAIYVVVSFTTLYEYAKGNSGPLKPGVQTVEGTVKTVIGPVYDKFHNVPLELLTFVDRKVGEVLSELDRHVPSLIKQASSQARSVASEIKRAGLVETATNAAKSAYVKYEPVAEEYYYKYEPVAEKYVVVAWTSLNRLPLFPQLAHILVPTASYWAERYNQSVGYFVSKGYAVSFYLPLVPIDRIAKVFKTSENGHSLRNGDADVVMSQ